MWLGEIDVNDDAEMRSWWEAAKEGDGYDRPYAAFWSLQAATVAFRAVNNAMEQHPLVARDGDEVLGTNQVMLPRLDNTHLALMTPITRPDHRRQGVGTALLEAGLELARSAGRSSVIIEVHRPLTDAGPAETPGTHLLSRGGFTEASLELHRVLELPVDPNRLTELEAEAAPHHSGYRLVTIDEVVPDDLMEGYCRLQTAFNSEAPLGDLDLEPEVWDEQRVRESEERFARQGRHERRVAAIGPDGTMVALTEMMATSHQPAVAWQGGTLVLKEHRGHRLGLATKVVNLRAFQVEFPQAKMVHSWNAEENGPMVAINDRLGFLPVEYLSEMQRKLDVADIEVGEIDRHNDDQLAAYWATGHEAETFERPYAAFWSLRAAKVALRGNDPTWRLVPLVARRGDEVLGATQVVMPQRDNTHLVITRPLVRPAYRRQGNGSALLDAVVALARAAGRDTIIIDADRPLGEDSSAGWEFLTHRGFTPGQHDIHRVLELPVDDAHLAAWAASAGPHHLEYELVQCSDDIPAAYVEGFCRLQTAFNSEAPLGALQIEPEVWSEERLRANEERRRGQGTWSETTLAIAPDGDVVGLTELSITDEGHGNCLQGATLVLRAHRGHRLGMALKVANLKVVQARAPQLPMVHSWNAEANAQMSAINAELGFRPVEEVAEMQRKV